MRVAEDVEIRAIQMRHPMISLQQLAILRRAARDVVTGIDAAIRVEIHDEVQLVRQRHRQHLHIHRDLAQQPATGAHTDASVVDARRGVVRDIDIDKNRLHALVRDAIIGRRKVECAGQRNERIGIPGARGAGVLVVRHHPLAVELHRSAVFWKTAGSLHSAKSGWSTVTAISLTGLSLSTATWKATNSFRAPVSLTPPLPDRTFFQQSAGLRIYLVKFRKRPDLHRIVRVLREPAKPTSETPGSEGQDAREARALPSEAHRTGLSGGAHAARREVIQLAGLELPPPSRSLRRRVNSKWPACSAWGPAGRASSAAPASRRQNASP